MRAFCTRYKRKPIARTGWEFSYPGSGTIAVYSRQGEERARLATGEGPELNQEYSFGALLPVVLNSNLNILKYL